MQSSVSGFCYARNRVCNVEAVAYSLGVIASHHGIPAVISFASVIFFLLVHLFSSLDYSLFSMQFSQRLYTPLFLRLSLSGILFALATYFLVHNHEISLYFVSTFFIMINFSLYFRFRLSIRRYSLPPMGCSI